MLCLTRGQRILSSAYAILIVYIFLSVPVLVVLGLPGLTLVVAWVGLAVLLFLPPPRRRSRTA
ncbi:MAG TPA: hypothetical protein VJ300_05650 [Thermoplasmata archaeon]|nr:hypothetical protein [Thermoplasmata archaeon]